MITHRIGTEIEQPLALIIEGETLTVTGGDWPYFGGTRIAAPSCQGGLLPTDRFIYLDTDGQIVISAEFIPYGRDLAGNDQDMRDLLAWKDSAEDTAGDGWHVKELYHAEQ